LFLPFAFCLLPFLLSFPVIAHQVQVDKQVGGTTHIEPNDNPRAGEPSLVWFALTRKGGELIPLKQCQCELTVSTEPIPNGDRSLQKPALKAVSAEGYQGIPGADITFPQVGTYELVLRGKPISTADFQPFTLKFTVTVVAGKRTFPSSQATEKETPTPQRNTQQPTSRPWELWAILISGGLLIGLGWWIWQQLREKQQ
ncbi:MAG: hypothetical protein ACRDEA_23055, partial [Microcystaceae cyanobacterium]